MSKHIILCADDYSLNASINAGILDLLAKQRLTAVSCMTQSSTWQKDAQALLPWKKQADIGLHFNLTQMFTDTFCTSLSLLMLQSHLRFVPIQQIRKSFCLQLDAFESAMQCVPDFIDGHQHVHMFPLIRDVVMDEYVQRYGSVADKPWVRSLENLPATTHRFKIKVLKGMGTQAHARLLGKHDIPHNIAFAGIYGFNPAENIDQCMQQWFAALPEGGLVMCHPALENNSGDDVIAAARFSEYTYLNSEMFIQTLNQEQVVLRRFHR